MTGACAQWVWWTASALAGGTPADRLPTPRPEPCLPFNADPADGEIAVPDGLGYDQVTLALNKVIQTALHCPRPEGRDELGLTFELEVGCDGVVSKVVVVEDDHAPDAYVGCVSAVIEKADFPAHDMADGMIITYPVNVAW